MSGYSVCFVTRDYRCRVSVTKLVYCAVQVFIISDKSTRCLYLDWYLPRKYVWSTYGQCFVYCFECIGQVFACTSFFSRTATIANQNFVRDSNACALCVQTTWCAMNLTQQRYIYMRWRDCCFVVVAFSLEKGKTCCLLLIRLLWRCNVSVVCRIVLFLMPVVNIVCSRKPSLWREDLNQRAGGCTGWAVGSSAASSYWLPAN